ncbi:hypothetical protein VUR80DRAFT_6241 [Thermomyces stellatus]
MAATLRTRTVRRCDPELENRIEQIRTKLSPPAYAEVQWWNGSSIYVRCPFCHDIHCHGFKKACYSNSQTRSSHCVDNRYGHYILHFPFDTTTGEAWYSIKEEEALFVAAAADPGAYFARFEDDELADDFKRQLEDKRLWTEATQMSGHEQGHEFPIFKWALKAAVTGDVEFLREYLQTSPEADIFLWGVEAYERGRVTGRTALQMAACEGHPGVVDLLLRKGADPNAQDESGRTPLMEAALWGRLENVCLLLESGADRDLVSVRNGQRLKAVDFARESEGNSAERNSNEGYREDVLERDRDRKEIVRLLGVPEQRRRDQRTLWGAYHIGDPNRDDLVTLVTHFDLPNPWKTVGVMYRPGGFAPVTSMSGWSHKGLNTRIAGEDWTDEVLKLCEAVGFSLTRDDKMDRGVPGRFYACHTEKQLIAYFVKSHVFLDSRLKQRSGKPGISGNGSLDDLMGQLSIAGKLAEPNKDALDDLHAIEPPVCLRVAQIVVCRSVCGDCKKFVRHINKRLGLDLEVYSFPSLKSYEEIDLGLESVEA